uniref:Uncharacterized protein n=1 Tax=Pyrodinium bahamense TaxID=73915 RepID=A0A7S0B9U9_9DINO
MGASLTTAESKLAARESLWRGEVASEQAKLATCEARVRELEPALESKSATLVKRNRHLAECDSYIQSLKGTLEKQEAELTVRADLEARCQDLEAALGAKQAELTERSEQLARQDSRFGNMEAWLGARRDDLERTLAELTAQSQMLLEREEHLKRVDSSLSTQAVLTARIQDLEADLAASRAELAARRGPEARLDVQWASAVKAEGLARPAVQALEATVRNLQTEVAERDRKLLTERSRVGKLQAIEDELCREQAGCAAPRAWELKPWEAAHMEVQSPKLGPHSKGLEASMRTSREELALQREELHERDSRLAQHESQAQALSSLLRARRAELDARTTQLQALQAQLTARDRRIAEQETKGRKLEELREALQARLEAQHEEIEGLEAHLRQRDGELAEQLATERALVAHGARLREAEETAAEACDCRAAQQEAQVEALEGLLRTLAAELEVKGTELQAQQEELEAQGRRLTERDLHSVNLKDACGALREELQAESRKRLAANEQLQASGLCASELRLCLEAHREELATAEASCAACEERLSKTELQLGGCQHELLQAEARRRAQHEEGLALEAAEARLQEQDRDHTQELAEGRAQLEERNAQLSRLEERLTQCLARLRKAGEDASAAREAAIAKRRSKQGLARTFLTIRGVDYTRLSAEPVVLTELQNGLQQVLALEAGPGVMPQDVALELWGGSVVVCATIVPPAGVSAGFVEAQLRSSTTLRGAVADMVAQVEGIEQVSTGPLTVIVHDVRPQARGGNTEGANPRGSAAGSSEADPAAVSSSAPAEQGAVTDKGSAEETASLTSQTSSGRLTEFFRMGTPRRWAAREPTQLDGAVWRRVRELEGKATPVEEAVEGVAAGGSGVAAAAAGGSRAATSDAPKGGARVCFRSRAYQA